MADAWDWHELRGVEPAWIEIDPWPPERAAHEFLQRYRELTPDRQLGSRWRSEHSRLCCAAGDYRPHDDLVAEAAERIGLSPDRAPALVARLGERQSAPPAAVLPSSRLENVRR